MVYGHHMTHTATAPAIRTPDVSEVLAAGRPFPMRDALTPMNHAAAVSLLRQRRAFWLAVAQHWMSLVDQGCTDATHDVQEALDQMDLYAPR